MPRIKKEETNVNPDSEDLDTFLGSGRHYQLEGVLTGTTTTDENVALDDIADNVIVERNGQQIINVTARDLIQMVDEWKGTVEVTNPTAGDTRICLPIPFWYPEKDPNVLRARSDEEIRVEIQFNQSTLSTRFGGNTPNFKLVSWRAPATQERYTPRLLKSRLSFNGSGEQDSEELNVSGLARLFFRETATDVIADQGLQIEWDGTVAVENISGEVLNDQANQLNRVESSPDDLLEFNPLDGPGAQGRSQSGAKVSVTSGASGDLLITRLIETQMRNG